MKTYSSLSLDDSERGPEDLLDEMNLNARDSGVVPIRKLKDGEPLRDLEEPTDPVSPTLESVLRSYSLYFGLSSQESRLLRCAVLGLTDKYAAGELGCSPNTIGTYWRRIYGKVACLGAREVVAHLCRFAVTHPDGRRIRSPTR